VDAFAHMVRSQDRLLILPIYDAGGTADRRVRSEDLVEKLVARKKPVAMVESLDAAEAEMRARAATGVALVTFGARDPGLPRLARRLAGV